MQFKALGKTTHEPASTLETFAAPACVSTVLFVTHELTSFCPVTRQPDLSTVEIEYAPNRVCVESKSLKLYLWSFRERGIFAEELAAEIVERVMVDTEPHWCEVRIIQQVRGGIQTKVTARKDA